jgi:hypothetical protein
MGEATDRSDEKLRVCESKRLFGKCDTMQPTPPRKARHPSQEGTLSSRCLEIPSSEGWTVALQRDGVGLSPKQLLRAYESRKSS